MNLLRKWFQNAAKFLCNANQNEWHPSKTFPSLLTQKHSWECKKDEMISQSAWNYTRTSIKIFPSTAADEWQRWDGEEIIGKWRNWNESRSTISVHQGVQLPSWKSKGVPRVAFLCEILKRNQSEKHWIFICETENELFMLAFFSFVISLRFCMSANTAVEVVKR